MYSAFNMLCILLFSRTALLRIFTSCKSCQFESLDHFLLIKKVCVCWNVTYRNFLAPFNRRASIASGLQSHYDMMFIAKLNVKFAVQNTIHSQINPEFLLFIFHFQIVKLQAICNYFFITPRILIFFKSNSAFQLILFQVIK